MDRSIIREIGFRDWLWRKGMRQFYRHLLKRPHLMDLPTGNRFALPIWSAFASEVFVSRSNVDWGSEALLCRLIRGRGAFLDVGANIGYYSVYMQPVVEQVFAFEPDPYARLHLNANVGSLPRISVVSCAVGPETTVARFVRSGRTQLSRLASQRDSVLMCQWSQSMILSATGR